MLAAPKRLNARRINRKKRKRTDELLVLRTAIPKTMPAARFASVPPAATSRESKSLDQAHGINRHASGALRQRQTAVGAAALIQ